MKKLFIVSVIAAGALAAQADSIFQASLTPGVAIYPKTTQIDGLSLSIWGQNPQSAVALGFVNGSTGDSCGFSAGIANYAESYSGLQWGVVNYTKEEFIGWQNGFVNWNDGSLKGLEWGAVNIADDAHGMQVGAFNYASKLSGVQIGFINIINDNGWFDKFPDKLAKGFVFVNWSF